MASKRRLSSSVDLSGINVRQVETPERQVIVHKASTCSPVQGVGNLGMSFGYSSTRSKGFLSSLTKCGRFGISWTAVRLYLQKGCRDCFVSHGGPTLVLTRVPGSETDSELARLPVATACATAS